MRTFVLQKTEMGFDCQTFEVLEVIVNGAKPHIEVGGIVLLKEIPAIVTNGWKVLIKPRRDEATKIMTGMSHYYA